MHSGRIWNDTPPERIQAVQTQFATEIAALEEQIGPPGASGGKFTVRPFWGGSPLLKQRFGSLRVCWQDRGAETRRDDPLERVAKNL
jgi:hypothetical protein